MQVKNLLLLGVISTKVPAISEIHSRLVTKNLIQLLREERAGSITPLLRFFSQLSLGVYYRGSAALILTSLLTSRPLEDMVLVIRIILGTNEVGYD